MTDDIVATVRAENNTELSRLGSSKALYAATGGEMEPEPVLRALADATHHAAETLADWGADPFADAAERERDHHEQVRGELESYEPGDPPAVVTALADLDGRTERLGGVVGWTLVAEQTAAQATGFFTGQADPATASLFRGFGDGYESIRESALAAIDDAAAAAEAATAVVQAAYDEYVAGLEAMGVNPKPVC
jgi:hypothetical protein